MYSLNSGGFKVFGAMDKHRRFLPVFKPATKFQKIYALGLVLIVSYCVIIHNILWAWCEN